MSHVITRHAALPYDRSAVTPGIVHLGVGAFHRAHQAVYLDDVLHTDPNWGIVGASLRRSDMRDALLDQGFLYTLVVRDSAATNTRVIGSLVDVMDAGTQRQALIETMADPRIKIVSLTVTEKGYCHDPATGALNAAHPDIIHDLNAPHEPISAPGLIVRALELRRERGLAPFTVLSCDNLPANGETVHRIITAFAKLRDDKLGAFVESSVACPSSMVDRIVPATSDADRDLVRQSAGYDDSWPVVTEPFTQWVIEDNFPQGRPDLASVGVQLVTDVAPYELMKLRMLNGSHSSLAYLGYLAGHQYVSDAIADEIFRRFVNALMVREVAPTLATDAAELAQYREALLKRFANPALKHRTWQIAMDGSQKVPQRLLNTIRARLAQGQSITLLSLGVAGWIRYVSGKDEQGQPIDVKDPLAARLRSIADASGTAAEQLVAGMLDVREVFGTDLPQNAQFRATLTSHLKSLLTQGSRATVAAVTNAL